jgi:hypothetical protein
MMPVDSAAEGLQEKTSRRLLRDVCFKLNVCFKLPDVCVKLPIA